MNDFIIINEDKFNKLNGEAQAKLMLKTTQNLINLSKLLDYFSGEIILENKQESYVSAHTSDDNIEITINSCITEKLIENDLFNSTKFINLINLFNNLYIEIKYPSENFNAIYEKLINLKRTKFYGINIMIFISGVEETGTYFKGNIEINAVKIDSNVKKISGGFEKGSFENCTNLNYISIGNSVTTIGGGAFYGCVNLEKIVIPDSVVNIEAGAFSNCSSLESIIIPSSVTEIKDNTFKNCSSLNKVIIADSVTKIGYNAFENCAVLTSIKFPTSLIFIYDCAFKNCMSLMDAKLPNSVKYLGNYAFYNCRYLKNFYIPYDIPHVGISVKDCDYFNWNWNYSVTYFLSDIELNISDNEEYNEYNEEYNEYDY